MRRFYISTRKSHGPSTMVAQQHVVEPNRRDPMLKALMSAESASDDTHLL